MKNWKCTVCGEITASEEAPESCPKCKAPADRFAAEENPLPEDTVQELDDDQLDSIVGGYAVGDVVRCKKHRIEYCPRCGTLLLNYEATITGIRGELDGKAIYWITRSCCGYRTCVSEAEIIG